MWGHRSWISLTARFQEPLLLARSTPSDPHVPLPWNLDLSVVSPGHGRTIFSCQHPSQGDVFSTPHALQLISSEPLHLSDRTQEGRPTIFTSLGLQPCAFAICCISSEYFVLLKSKSPTVPKSIPSRLRPLGVVLPKGPKEEAFSSAPAFLRLGDLRLPSGFAAFGECPLAALCPFPFPLPLPPLAVVSCGAFALRRLVFDAVLVRLRVFVLDAVRLLVFAVARSDALVDRLRVLAVAAFDAVVGRLPVFGLAAFDAIVDRLRVLAVAAFDRRSGSSLRLLPPFAPLPPFRKMTE